MSRSARNSVWINKFWVLWDNWCGHNSDGSNIHLFECEMAPDNNLEWASREIKIFTPHASFGKKEFMSKSQSSHLEIVNLIIISPPCRLKKVLHLHLDLKFWCFYLSARSPRPRPAHCGKDSSSQPSKPHFTSENFWWLFEPFHKIFTAQPELIQGSKISRNQWMGSGAPMRLWPSIIIHQFMMPWSLCAASHLLCGPG